MVLILFRRKAMKIRRSLMAKEQEPKKIINVHVPAKLYDLLKMTASRSGLSITQIIVQYLEYLRGVHVYHRTRAILHNKSNKENFELAVDPSKPNKLREFDYVKS